MDKKIAFLVTMVIGLVLFLTLLPLMKNSVDNFECEVCVDFPDEDYIYLTILYEETDFYLLEQDNMIFHDIEGLLNFTITNTNLTDLSLYGSSWYLAEMLYVYYDTSYSEYKTIYIYNNMDYSTIKTLFDSSLSSMVEITIIIGEI